ncbi:MAG TPA: AAA family ATPase [Noviherbaspirillum sp.]|uniref:AAA family ATPase n=1 Tax=Noviherbaspirillum sp. TaxID=1926288 RepID=UPI002B49D8CD|nr:AAA family ATPase [Noviherbaspirillum sp.]HJV88381.1 AAA family ATPase [Noviherbaspirillum sp.]
MDTFLSNEFEIEVESAQARAARATLERAPGFSSLMPYRALNISELIQTPLKPRERMLAPWLLTQSLAMLYAWRGVGKTHVALGIGYAVASGGIFLGWKATEPRRVLYLDGEMPGITMQSRLKTLIVNNPVIDFDPDNFKLLTPDLQDGAMPDLATLQGQDAIYPLTEHADLIIVDNLSTLARSGCRENDAEYWNEIGEWAQMMRREGRSVLFIHHSGKGGAQRGTSKKEDILDTVINLKRPADYVPDEGAKFEVHFEKARELFGEDVEPFEAKLVTDANGNQTWATTKLTQSTFERVVALANEGLSQSEIGIELNIHKSSVSRHLHKAHELGLAKGASK